MATPDFVQEFDRITGCHLAAKDLRSPIVAMVDQATGFEEQQKELDRRKFVAFVYETVWLRLPEGSKDPTEVVESPSGGSFAELMRDQAV